MQIEAKVWVHAMGTYYAGTVVKRTAKRATVRYTSGAGVTRDKAIPYNPASGMYAEKYAQAFPLVARVDGTPAPRGARQLSGSEKGPDIYAQAQAARARAGQA